MRKLFVAILVVISAAAAANAQRPAPRRSLDSLDLLTVDRPARYNTGPAVYVDLETYQFLGRIIELARTIESTHRETIIEKKTPAERAEFYPQIGSKTLVLLRSMVIAQKAKEMPDPVCDLLTEDFEVLQNVARVIGAINLKQEAKVSKEIGELAQKFGVTGTAENSQSEVLIATMLKRVVEDLARIKVG
jgi:hypothetical protein